MTRRLPPAEERFATGLAHLICAYYWRAGGIGQHQAHAPCQSCQRLVDDDLRGLLRDLLVRAMKVGAEHGPEPSIEAMQEVAGQCAEICINHCERVVQSDPRTIERKVERSRTDRADVVFVATEYPDGTPWILLEPSGPTLAVLKERHAHLGLEFRDGVSLQEAERFAAQMRAKLRGVTYCGRAE